MSIPRSEYPRPQFVRQQWLCLNGLWQFEIDTGDSGLDRGILGRDLTGVITVPFCPESTLSGIGNTDFMAAVWYRRVVRIPTDWAGQKVLLHFGAVDYDATVWVNGVEVVRHRGGFTPFTADLSELAEGGKDVTIVVRARDDHRPPQARGKQSQAYGNQGCHYTRTTGIWQTVWMEPVPKSYLKRPRITPDLAQGVFHVDLPLSGNNKGNRIRATLLADGQTLTISTARADLSMCPRLVLTIPAGKARAWSIEEPFLYDLQFELLDASDRPIDTVKSYAGLRSVTIEGKAIKINGKSVFQRLVLDQGYYPDGLMTAPSDEALIQDIKLSMSAGFNGARLHQKVFEERFLYWADKLGYLCWGEFPDWGCANYGPYEDHQQPGSTYTTQWLEALERDYSHPSIIGWCGLNETHQAAQDRTTNLDDVTRGMFLAAKAMDPTRPVLDASGYSHRVLESDVYDSHDYEQNPVKFSATHAGLKDGKPYINLSWQNNRPVNIPYRGQPYFVSEFGGIWWNPSAREGDASWGYGERPKTVEEFYIRFEGLCATLLGNVDMFGYCYTQLTDVFQEQNGIYSFNRTGKFDMARIRAVQTIRAAIEKLP